MVLNILLNICDEKCKATKPNATVLQRVSIVQATETNRYVLARKRKAENEMENQILGEYRQ